MPGAISLSADVFAFDEPSVIQALPKGIDSICEADSRGASKKSDYWHRCLLRAHRERPRCHCSAEQRDEVAPPHSAPKPTRPIGTVLGGFSRSSVNEKAI